VIDDTLGEIIEALARNLSQSAEKFIFQRVPSTHLRRDEPMGRLRGSHPESGKKRTKLCGLPIFAINVNLVRETLQRIHRESLMDNSVPRACDKHAPDTEFAELGVEIIAPPNRIG